MMRKCIAQLRSRKLIRNDPNTDSSTRISPQHKHVRTFKRIVHVLLEDGKDCDRRTEKSFILIQLQGTEVRRLVGFFGLGVEILTLRNAATTKNKKSMSKQENITVDI